MVGPIISLSGGLSISIMDLVLLEASSSSPTSAEGTKSGRGMSTKLVDAENAERVLDDSASIDPSVGGDGVRSFCSSSTQASSNVWARFYETTSFECLRSAVSSPTVTSFPSSLTSALFSASNSRRASDSGDGVDDLEGAYET